KAYQDSGDVEAAIVYNQKSVQIYEELGLIDQVACALDNVTALYVEYGNITRARESLVRAEKLAEDAKRETTLASIKASQAEVMAKTDSDKAIEEAQNALKFARKVDQVDAQVRMMVLIGELRMKTNGTTARRSFQEARQLAEERAPYLLRTIFDRWSRAEEERHLLRGKTALDATSGNTGIALAMVCAVRGHTLELCMPDKVSEERKKIVRAFGGSLVLTDPLEGTDGAIREAQRRARGEPDRYVYLDQYSNPANPLAHELGTGPEIWDQTGGRITHFVAGVGTSGTIIGVSAALRPKGVRIVAVQPDDAFHGIEGWKHMASAMRPAIWDERAADDHRVVSTDAAIAMTRRLAREEGIFSGVSGGAAVVAALAVAREEGGHIV